MVEVELPDLAGKTVGEYLLVRRIGRGGMGLVYEGVQPVIGKKVAVKFLLPELSADERLVRQFVTEARLVNAIAHRGIVDIFSFGHFEGMQYFVMEYLEGRAFDALVCDEAPLSESLTVQYLAQMIDALGAAHRAGVIHRDVKSSNVFLVEHAGERPYVKLLDFGIAKSGADATAPVEVPLISRQSLVVGTPEYIAPEQAQGLALGPWTDLYSAGCVAFELLTGRLPHQGKNPFETMFKHVTDPTPRVSQFRPVTEDLDDFIYALMAKNPAERPASAAEALERLAKTTVALEAAAVHATVELPAVTGAITVAANLSPTWPKLLMRPPPPRAPRSRLAMGLALVAGLLAGLYLFAPAKPQSEAAPPPPAPEPKEEPAAPSSSSFDDPVFPDEPSDPELASNSAARLARKAVAEKISVELPRDRVLANPSEQALDTHLAAIHLKLARKETSRGERLDVVRMLLETAERRRVAATTGAQRREIGATLDDIDRLLAR
ncbi:MAG: serine/threonine-protein kinase [Myxococcaceae bacterium]